MLNSVAVQNLLFSISVYTSTPVHPQAFPYSNPSPFPASFDFIIPLLLVRRSSYAAFNLSTIPLGLLSHYRFRLETEVESAAAGYSNDAEGGRSSQEGDNVRHLGDSLAAYLE